MAYESVRYLGAPGITQKTFKTRKTIEDHNFYGHASFQISGLNRHMGHHRVFVREQESIDVDCSFKE